VAKTGRLLFSRKIVICISLFVCAIGIGLCGIAKTPTSAVCLMTIGIFAEYLTISNFWAIVQDTVKSEHVGGAGGFVHFISNVSGILSPSVTGFIIQYTSSYSSGFFVAGFVAIVGMVAIASWVKAPGASLDRGAVPQRP
jgi:ACS family hexuronate transporter-like MFS transporter